MSQNKQSNSWFQTIRPFAQGGFSGCFATCIIQPVDMIKVAIQIQGEENGKLKAAGKPIVNSTSPISVFQNLVKSKGFSGLYRGLDAALTRQIFYTTTRLGIYNKMFNSWKESKGSELNFFQKSCCSVTAGFIGAIIGTPPDLILIRMQADSSLPEAERRNYKSVSHAFQQIVKNEGVGSLWTGCFPTVVRAVVLNFGMLGPYDEAKELCNRYINGDVKKDSQLTRLLASAMAGFLASFLSLPFDNAKTKMQKMKALENGKMPYANIFDCIKQTASREGVSGLWIGFPTFYARIAPHVMMTLVMNDFLNDLAKKL